MDWTPWGPQCIVVGLARSWAHACVFNVAEAGEDGKRGEIDQHRDFLRG